MEQDLMGKVIVTVKIENLHDLYDEERGLLCPEQVRSLDITNALVDTGATTLSMPRRMIEQLGLRPYRQRRARTAAGSVTLQMHGAVRLTIQDRDCISDVAEVPEDCPVLIGQIPLEALDLVVDSAGRRLIGNPEHGGEHMIELY